MMRHGEQADEGKRANKARASFDARTANAASQSHKKSLDRSRPKSVLSVIIIGGERTGNMSRTRYCNRLL